MDSVDKKQEKAGSWITQKRPLDVEREQQEYTFISTHAGKVTWPWDFVYMNARTGQVKLQGGSISLETEGVM